MFASQGFTIHSASLQPFADFPNVFRNNKAPSSEIEPCRLAIELNWSSLNTYLSHQRYQKKWSCKNRNNQTIKKPNIFVIIQYMLFNNNINIVILIGFKFCTKHNELQRQLVDSLRSIVFAANQIMLQKFEFCRLNLPRVVGKQSGSQIIGYRKQFNIFWPIGICQKIFFLFYLYSFVKI